MEWWNQIIEFFKEGSLANLILDAYLVFAVISFFFFIVLRNKKMMILIIPMIIVAILTFLAIQFNLAISSKVLLYLCVISPVIIIVIAAPDLHSYFEARANGKEMNFSKGTSDNKHAIADAVFKMSEKHIGAIITFERHKLLDQFSEKAIILNADITQELILNVFVPNTPLHDGAVIIKGNKIRCAGAYYVLSTREIADKTVGSRHRAALGISEISDSITIVVSEETGKVSVAYSGILITINEREKLLEYLDLAME